MIKSGFSGAGEEEFSGSLGPTDIVGLVVTHMLAHRFEPDDGVRIYAGYLVFLPRQQQQHSFFSRREKFHVNATLTLALSDLKFNFPLNHAHFRTGFPVNFSSLS